MRRRDVFKAGLAMIASPAVGTALFPAAAAAASGTVPAPAIRPRAAWGADEKLMTWAPEYAPTLLAVTIHHTDDGHPNGYTKSQVPGILRAIYHYHAVTRKWGDIGYNFLVDRFGRVWEGRAGGVDQPVIGAHAAGFNSGTCGIAVIGDYDADQFPRAARRALSWLVAWKLSQYGLDPHGSAVLTSAGDGGTSKYPLGQQVTVPVVMGHRDTGRTDCPGNHGYSQLPLLRDIVATDMRDPR